MSSVGVSSNILIYTLNSNFKSCTTIGQ
jgi:hypothetical protein